METVLLDQPLEEMLRIDEQITPFKARLNVRMMHLFRIYEVDSSCTDFGIEISGNIIIELASTIHEHRNYKLYFDNWFSSISLAKQLQDKGIWCVGTIWENRIPNPPLKTDQELKKEGRGTHSCAVDSNSGIVISNWFDNRVINFISTYAAVEPNGTCKIWSAKDKKHIQIPRPEVVSQYNKFMGRVDLADIIIELYCISMKSKRD
ncbi:hypothetical protein PR048_022622 [Dryococelus australis]|uniref:PiggyBac transposable element-derived protein domain-containing protein n=1 Tax=Dryococelus australis TaxID=614101 RepID=A0ABQ9H1L1_9NEOP|nr:hypothetical protein PR048_022622 [Dryococelus australis]